MVNVRRRLRSRPNVNYFDLANTLTVYPVSPAKPVARTPKHDHAENGHSSNSSSANAKNSKNSNKPKQEPGKHHREYDVDQDTLFPQAAVLAPIGKIRRVLGSALSIDLALLRAYEPSADNSKKIRPEGELAKAAERIERAKRNIIALVSEFEKELEKLPRLDSAYDEQGEIDAKEIFCSFCRANHSDDDNDILLCDGKGCDRAFHQKCISERHFDKEEVEDEDWFCPGCSLHLDTLERINGLFETEFELGDTLFPELVAKDRRERQRQTRSADDTGPMSPRSQASKMIGATTARRRAVVAAAAAKKKKLTAHSESTPAKSVTPFGMDDDTFYAVYFHESSDDESFHGSDASDDHSYGSAESASGSDDENDNDEQEHHGDDDRKANEGALRTQSPQSPSTSKSVQKSHYDALSHGTKYLLGTWGSGRKDTLARRARPTAPLLVKPEEADDFLPSEEEDDDDFAPSASDDDDDDADEAAAAEEEDEDQNGSSSASSASDRKKKSDGSTNKRKSPANGKEKKKRRKRRRKQRDEE